MEFDNMALPRV